VQQRAIADAIHDCGAVWLLRDRHGLGESGSLDPAQVADDVLDHREVVGD